MFFSVRFSEKGKLIFGSRHNPTTAFLFIHVSKWLKIKGITTNSNSTNMTTLERLPFDNLVLRSLPVESNTDNYVRQVAAACFSKVKPTPVENPKTVCYSPDAMSLLDLPKTELQRPEFALYFSGNEQLPGSETASHCYCGHQFGQFAGQLGDGAAIYLGEIVNKKGERWELQLKGAGKTPYSRQADGRKVLRSSIREFLCSEAMHYLGIPTTRAGACITSDTTVIRDIFYNGNPIHEKASIVLRIAPTFIRFGSFEIFKTRDEMTGRVGPSVGRYEILKQLLEYVISTFYPEIDKAYSSDDVEKYKLFLREVVLRTARLVAEWQCVGFCHGVLNTDNMSIVGLTIDYGPYGFMDRYNPDHICNASDEGGRYSYKKQPEICYWNLKKFTEVLEHFLPREQSSDALRAFYPEYKRHYEEKMRKKLGLIQCNQPQDEKLIQEFLNVMEDTGADFTNCFRGLSLMSLPECKDHEESKKMLLNHLMEQSASLEELKQALSDGMEEREFQMYVMLLNTQPEILQMLGRGVGAIERELERRKKIQKLNELEPAEKKRRDCTKWENWLANYASRLKFETENVANVENFNIERRNIMNANNPRVVLRNYIAQNAITKAETGDFSEVQKLLKILTKPYDDPSSDETLDLSMPSTSERELDDSADSSLTGATAAEKSHQRACTYDSRPPEWARGLRVT